jgi:hypothetical protein
MGCRRRRSFDLASDFKTFQKRKKKPPERVAKREDCKGVGTGRELDERAARAADLLWKSCAVNVAPSAPAKFFQRMRGLSTALTGQ